MLYYHIFDYIRGPPWQDAVPRPDLQEHDAALQLRQQYYYYYYYDYYYYYYYYCCCYYYYYYY